MVQIWVIFGVLISGMDLDGIKIGLDVSVSSGYARLEDTGMSQRSQLPQIWGPEGSQNGSKKG